ncbi:class I SAM-dependent methyltransferase [Nocardia sp. NBC_00508]|uniref:class I SAM-dependent methyltransferase n=1 Tax=Nocardia sp. NBC_00508 TaxID=2975992 RepID=UPI002E817FE8|nr:class I SAM-dependent methyltransferase [Nocardia sp. NBC_00508]WUD65951.1 class I SAM-dependent methyltransferase [Nocardia sp. NBC_00508]
MDWVVQSGSGIRVEWGQAGARALGPHSAALVVVDVLSFTTAVSVAVGAGTAVLPYPWRDGGAEEFAALSTDVRTSLALSGTERIVDIGCGTGQFLRTVRDSGHRGCLVGTDIHPAAVAAVTALDTLHAFQADALHLPFPDADFDRATAMHLLYYLSDPAAGLAEMHRVTRPGGRVAVTLNQTATAPRLRALVAEHAARHGFATRPATQIWASAPTTATPLDVDSAAELMRIEFGHATVWRRDNALLFPTPGSVLRYADVLARFACGVPEDSPHRQQIAHSIGGEVRDWFARHGGPWRDPKGYTVLTAHT